MQRKRRALPDGRCYCLVPDFPPLSALAWSAIRASRLDMKLENLRD
jgi:hypothetical protein